MYLLLELQRNSLATRYPKHKICFLNSQRKKKPTILVRLDVLKLGSSERFREAGSEFPKASLSSLCVIFQQIGSAADMGDLYV